MLRLSRCFRLLFFFFPQRHCCKSLLSRVGRKENGLEGDRSSPPPICWLMQLSHEGSFFVQLRRSASVRRRQARVMQRMYCMYKLPCTDMPFGGEGSDLRVNVKKSYLLLHKSMIMQTGLNIFKCQNQHKKFSQFLQQLVVALWPYDDLVTYRLVFSCFELVVCQWGLIEGVQKALVTTYSKNGTGTSSFLIKSIKSNSGAPWCV